MYCRMMSAKSRSAPGRAPRRALRSRPWASWRRCRRTSRRARSATARAHLGPATASSASSISATVTLSAGRLSASAAAERLDAASIDRDQAFDRARRRRHRMRHAGVDRADRLLPASGSRMMPLKNDDAAPLGLPGRTVTVIRRAAAAVDEALARVVGDQVLAHQLVRAVAGLRRRQRVVAHQRRHRRGRVGAEHRDRAGEHEPRGRALPARAQRVEQRARAVEVGAQAELEVGLALARYRRREVEHAVELVAAKRIALREQRPDAHLDARIAHEVGAVGGGTGRPAPADRSAGRPSCRASTARVPGASRRNRRRR